MHDSGIFLPDQFPLLAFPNRSYETETLPNASELAQVTEMRVIFKNFGASIARKFNADGATHGET
jgi:hypothetical protein